MSAISTAIIHWIPDRTSLLTSCNKSAMRRRVACNFPTTGPQWTVEDVTCKACLKALGRSVPGK